MRISRLLETIDVRGGARGDGPGSTCYWQRTDRRRRAALAFAAAFPWSETARAHVVMARGGLPAPRRADPWPAGTWRALDDAFEREARRATRVRCPCRVRLRSRRFSRRRA